VATVSAGTNTTPRSSSDASSSSGRDTSPTSCRAGFRRSTGSRRSCSPAPGWPTSAAGSGRRGSIELARKRAADAGVADRIAFETASAQTFAGTGYDLVATFDCLHDMGDPTGAAEHIRSSLDPDGTWLIVEPFAGDAVSDNMNPVGRVYYNFSTLLCVPNALSQPGGYSLGAQAGEQAIAEVVSKAGFTRFRRAAETPFNIVYEARP
jgi:hypothetical protein